jgi:tetratricopeptide (TPR) repeat protein
MRGRFLALETLAHWQELQKANRLLHSGSLLSAFGGYQAVIANRIENYLPPSPNVWRIINDSESPSLNWACIYLGEYYLIRRGGWNTWRIWANALFKNPDFVSLDHNCCSLLISLKGWAEVLSPKVQLEDLVREQEHALANLAVDDLKKALHHTILAYLYQQLRIPQKAFYHNEQALQRLSFEQNPFHTIYARENLGATYYFLHDLDQTYSEKAISIYQGILDISNQPELMPVVIRQHYNLGWVYAEQPDADKAIYHFRQGYRLAQKIYLESSNLDNLDHMEYEMALNQYGEGFALYCLGEIQTAESTLQQALAMFDVYKADLMVAMCLQIIAACCEKNKKLKEASAYVNRAEKIQLTLNNPVQFLHLKQRLAYIHFKSFHIVHGLKYWLEYRQLKKQLDK